MSWPNERGEGSRRADNALDELYVVSSTRAEQIDPNDTTLSTLKISLTGVHLGEFIIVMPAADRNLLDIFQKERPDIDRIREMVREVIQCLAHVHEKGLSHGDIKMNNVVRVDEKLRLIDLDAVAKLGGEASFIGAKFSSAVLPPEMLYRLRDDDELRAFEDYWREEKAGDTELWRKIAPKRDAKGDHFVVKTFRVAGDGDAPDRSRSLPYDLVPATRAVDIWAIGALLFYLLVKAPIVPSDLDDDCANGDAMATICDWNDETARVKLARVDDLGARDLLSRLLVADPSKRLGLSDALEHVFFDPKNAQKQRALDLKYGVPFIDMLPAHIDKSVVEDCVMVASDVHDNGLPESKSIDGKYAGNHYGFTIVVGNREELLRDDEDGEPKYFTPWEANQILAKPEHVTSEFVRRNAFNGDGMAVVDGKTGCVLATGMMGLSLKGAGRKGGGRHKSCKGLSKHGV